MIRGVNGEEPVATYNDSAPAEGRRAVDKVSSKRVFKIGRK
jgi:hypothetical protein